MSELETSTHGIFTVQSANLHEMKEHVFSVRYSPDHKYVGAALGNGALRIFEANTLRSVQRTKLGNPYDEMPSPAFKWSPHMTSSGEYQMASISSVGAVFCWGWDGKSFLDRQFRFTEEKNDTTALDFSPDGKYIVTAGSDRNIRLYDIANKKCAQVLCRGVNEEGHTRAAHTNRIFSLKYLSPTTMVSAGWESPVQIWDMRTGRAERQVGGIQPGGDCLEVIPGTTRFICVNNRCENQIQVFDYLGAREIVDESKRLSANLGKIHLSSCRYHLNTQRLWFASSNPSGVGYLDFATGAVKGYYESPLMVMSLDSHHAMPKRCVVGCAQETMLIIDAAE